MAEVALLLMFMALKTYIGIQKPANQMCLCLAAISNMAVQSFRSSCWSR